MTHAGKRKRDPCMLPCDLEMEDDVDLILPLPPKKKRRVDKPNKRKTMQGFTRKSFSCELYFVQDGNEIQSCNNKSNKSNNIIFSQLQSNLIVSGYCRNNNFIINDLYNIITNYFNGSSIIFNLKTHKLQSIYLDLNGISLITNNNINNDLINIELQLKESNCFHNKFSGFYCCWSLVAFPTTLKKENCKY